MISEYFITPLDFASSMARMSKDIDLHGEASLTALAAMLLLNQRDVSKVVAIVNALFGHDAAREIGRVINEQADQPQGPWTWLDKNEGIITLRPDRVFDLMAPDREKVEAGRAPDTDPRPMADIIP